MAEYVRIMEPVLTKQQHDRLKNIVRQFEAGIGQNLQNYLMEKREEEDNWVRLITK